MTHNKIITTIVLLSGLTLVGCANSQTHSANQYQASQMQQVSQVRQGVIESVRDITVDNARGIGTVTGAVIGGVAAGNNIGGGSGRIVSGALGAVAGGLLGNRTESALSSQRAQELTIRMHDTQERVAVVQSVEQRFFPNQIVDVIIGTGSARVVPVLKRES